MARAATTSDAFNAVAEPRRRQMWEQRFARLDAVLEELHEEDGDGRHE